MTGKDPSEFVVMLRLLNLPNILFGEHAARKDEMSVTL